jgi:hypothetical protein
MPNKRKTSFTLSKEALKLLATLSKKHGLSRTAYLELALRSLWYSTNAPTGMQGPAMQILNQSQNPMPKKK